MKKFAILTLSVVFCLEGFGFDGGFKKLYEKECGSCHTAYQPEFLPKRSWEKMMADLGNHFDTDASLNKEEKEKILKYLVENAGDVKKVDKEYKEFIESIPKNETPLKISEVPYFVKEHKKIDKKLINQKEVKTISNCVSCHRDAKEGKYLEKNIFIPNYGRWED